MGLKTLVISKWIEICMDTILNLLWEQSWPKYDSKFNIAYSIAPYGFPIMAVFLGTQIGQFSISIQCVEVQEHLYHWKIEHHALYSRASLQEKPEEETE